MDDEPERESRKVKVTLGWVVEKAVKGEHASSVHFHQKERQGSVKVVKEGSGWEREGTKGSQLFSIFMIDIF